MERLRMCREQKGLSQKQVALEIGVRPPTVSQWESGIKAPSRANMEKLADIYGVSVDYLLGREKQPLAEGEGLKGRIISLLDSLSPAELQRVDDFLSGLKSGQKEPGSPRP